MNYRFDVTQLRPDLKEDLYRLDVEAEGEAIYQESWYLRASDLVLLIAKMQAALDRQPTTSGKEKT